MKKFLSFLAGLSLVSLACMFGGLLPLGEATPTPVAVVSTLAPTEEVAAPPAETPTSAPMPTATATSEPPAPIATPTLTVTPALTVTVTLAPTTVVTTITDDFKPGWDVTWYWNPFRQTTDTLADTATHETFAEPGERLDNTAVFDHMSAAETPLLVPEGGYAYIAIGAVSLEHSGVQLNLYHQDGNIYLVIIRGMPDDGTNVDLNQIVGSSNYVRGTGIYSPMPSGAYVSLGWMLQQVQASYRDPNCGLGCQRATIVVVDLATHTFRMWVQSDPKNLRDWSRVSD